MSLLIFLLLHQIVLVNGASTYSVKITRVIFRGKQEDSFELPKSYAWCSSQNECNRFNANLSPSGSLKHSCLCSCSRLMAATFGVKNGSWSCIGNKEIRDRELDGKLHWFVVSQQCLKSPFLANRRFLKPLDNYNLPTKSDFC